MFFLLLGTVIVILANQFEHKFIFVLFKFSGYLDCSDKSSTVTHISAYRKWCCPFYWD